MSTSSAITRFRLRRWSRSIALNLAVVAILVWSLAPFLWLLRSSLSPIEELTRVPTVWWPETWTTDNYREIVKAFIDPGRGASPAETIGLGLQNSIIVAVLATVTNMVIGFPAAYGFSRSTGRLSGFMLSSLVVSRMVPVFALIVPLFLVFSRVGLYDTFAGLVLADLAATLPFTVYLMKSYLDTVGTELDDAGRVDGASRLQVLVHIMLPAARPAIAAAAIFAFLQSWNSFLFPLVLSSDPHVMTVQPQIAATYGLMDANYGILFASTVIVCIPPIVLALALQSQLSKGLLAGAVKD